MNDDEPQLIKDLTQMSRDIKTIAEAICIVIQYSAPYTGTAKANLLGEYKIMQTIIDRYENVKND